MSGRPARRRSMNLREALLGDRLALGSEVDSVRRRQVREMRRLRRDARGREDARERLDRLEDDVGYLSLVLAALIRRLDEKGSVRREELDSVLAELDGLDGLEDGRLSVEVLKQMGSGADAS